MKPIRIALTKGRLEKDSVEMFEKLGYDCTAVHEKGRRLILPVVGTNLEIVLAKAADVVTYVENGVCDIGVVGRDTIMEKGGTFYEVADLGFGKCRFALAVPKGVDFYEGYHTRCTTLKENGLVIAEYISDISARLIVNIASLKLRKAEIEPFITRIEDYLKERADA